MSVKFIVNSERSRDEFIDKVYKMFDEHKHISFSCDVGGQSILTQKALFHIWLRQYAAHLLKTSEKNINEELTEGMKKEVKRRYYNETAESFMVKKIKSPYTGQTKLALTSCKEWSHGEMHDVMSWMQIKAAQDGLVLESKGEYERNIKA